MPALLSADDAAILSAALFAERRAVIDKTLAAAPPGGGRCAALALLRDFWRAFLTCTVRPQHVSVVAGDFYALIAAGAGAALAFERTDAAGFRFHRVQRIDAGELDVEFRAGLVVEQ